MVDRRSLLVGGSIVGLAAAPAVAQTPTVGPRTEGALRFDALPRTIVAGVVYAANFGAVGDGKTDDTLALQSALDAAAGKTLILEPRTYKTTETLYLKGHGTRLEGRGAFIDYYGQQSALSSSPVTDTVYLQHLGLRHLTISVHVEGAQGFTGLIGHSTVENVEIVLRNTARAAIGFVLVGDEVHGTGPYYNTFLNCAVQGQGTKQIGVLFAHAPPLHRAPNANSWVGGRVGQCHLGFSVAGCGNSFFNPTVEGCQTAFHFDGGIQNFVFGCYLELCKHGFIFSPSSQGNGITGIYGTGIETLSRDLGKSNWILSQFSAMRFPRGISVGEASSNQILRHYQKGVWTPTIRGAGAGGAYSASVDAAQFVRIGDQVTALAEFSVVTTQEGSGTATFGGLPFARSTHAPLLGQVIASGLGVPLASAPTFVTSTPSSAGTEFLMACNTEGNAPDVLAVHQINSGARFRISLVYFTETLP